MNSGFLASLRSLFEPQWLGALQMGEPSMWHKGAPPSDIFGSPQTFGGFQTRSAPRAFPTSRPSLAGLRPGRLVR